MICERKLSNIMIKMLFVPLLVLVILSIGFLVYVQYSTSQLPERVATHFGADGTPNGWMSRDKHLLFMGIFGVGIPLFIVGLVLISKFIPISFVNLPNRDYWLAPERKQESYLYISRYMIWMGCIMFVFFAGIQYSIVKANQSSPVKMPNELFWPLLIGFLVVMALWTIAFYLRFSKKRMIENNNTQI